MKNHGKELGIFLDRYVKTCSISFLREDPHAFASRLLKIFSILYLSDKESNSLEVLKVKALNGLWNNVLDDIIEYTDKGRNNIVESLEALMKSMKGERFDGKTETGKIMYDFVQEFHNLPLGPNKKISEELVFLDLLRILNGFDYERIIHENGKIGTFSEYMEFATATVDLRIMLDIDIAVCLTTLDPSTIGDLREAYRWFDQSFRLISDIASFEREYFLEASLNSVILYGYEKGALDRDILRGERAYKEKLFRDVIPSLINDIEDMAEEDLSRSLAYLEKISEIDIRHMSRAFRSLCEEYPWHIDFSPPPAKGNG